MIEEAVAIGIIGGVGLTIADKMNVLGINPTGVWWWERIFPKPPAARISQQAIQAQQILSPAAELRKIETEIHYAEQMANGIKRAHPELQVSKYALTAQSREPDLVYRPKTYP